MTTRFNDFESDIEGGYPRLLLIGVDHRCAPIELREKVSYDEEAAEALLNAFATGGQVDEACLVSTCNRTEVYLLPRRDRDVYRVAFDATFGRRAPEIETEGRFYVKRGSEAARHLFEVAAGLQSMVLGEPEILGQVKKAAQLADRIGSSGAVLHRLMRSAIAAAGKARRETAISTGAVSFGYAVVDLARSIFERLESCEVLMVGAGDTARQVARNLLERGARELNVTNRGRRRAEEFLNLFPGARAVPFDQRGSALGRADVIVVTTRANAPVLGRSDLERAMEKRRGRPMLVADLGVPRNVEVGSGEIADLFLQDLDSLEDLIRRNLKHRRDEVPRAQDILEQELARYVAWYRGLAAEPLVARLQKRAEQIRSREVESARNRFPVETHPYLERLTRSLVRKLLHHPSTHLRGEGASDFRQLEAVRHLFRLDED